MNIETIEVSGDITEYTYFGWEHTQDTTHRLGPSRHTRHVLVRNRNMKNYSQLAELQDKYFDLKSSIRHYEPLDPATFAILLLLLIFPAFIYLSYKSNQKNEINAYNDSIRSQMNEIAKMALEYQTI